MIDTVGGLPLDTNYIDPTVVNGQAYYYQIVAKDSRSNSSDGSNVASAIPKGILFVDVTNGSDDSGTGSTEDPYQSIQYSIENASNADTIFVKPGTYAEELDLMGKWISIRSISGPGVTFLDLGNFAQTVAILANSGESKNTEVMGFTIKRYATGLLFEDGSSPTIKDCIIDQFSPCKYFSR